MGDWQISVHGTGSHHNGNPDIDADLATREFVKKLVLQGHTVREAKFTQGGFNDVLYDVFASNRQVVINACRAFLPTRSSYAEIVKAAKSSVQFPRLVAYRRRGADCMQRVTVCPTDYVNVEDGMIFDVSCATPV